MDILQDYLFVFVAGAVLIILERLLPMHHGQKTLRKGWKVDLLHVFVSGTVIRIATTITVLLASVMAVSVVPETIRDAVRSQPLWLEFIELLILSDLCFYAAHRLCHSVPFLWRFHAVHHSSEQMDWLATYRVHPVDQVLNSTIIALPIIVLGFSPAAVLLYAVIYRIQAPWLHSNVQMELGWLGKLFTTPRFHHWHHADQSEAYNKNYAGQLSIIDRIFGTHFQPSAHREPEKYGVGGSVPANYIGQIIQPFGITPLKKSAKQTPRPNPLS